MTSGAGLRTDDGTTGSEADHVQIAQPEDTDVPPEEVSALVVTAYAGSDPAAFEGKRIRVEGTATGVVYRGGRPLQVTEFDGDGDGDRHGPALLLPLRASADTVSGVLSVVRTAGREPFDDRQLFLATSFTDQAALALKLADDQRRLNSLTVFADRDRIARDLHDHVIQRLFAHGLNLQSTHARTRSPEIRGRLADMIDDVQSIITDVRTAIFDLHSGPESGRQLRQALQDIVAEQTADAGLRTVVRMSGPLNVITGPLADHAEAVLREAMSNVVHHSGADTVTVTVSVDDYLTLDVTDNGIGLPATVARSGLHNLASRAEDAAGTFAAAALATGGTRVLWSAPLPED